MATHVLIPGKTDLSAAASYESATAPASWSNGDKLHILEGSQTLTNLSAISINLNEIYVGPEARVVCQGLVVNVTNGTTPRVRIYGSGGEFWHTGNSTQTEVQGTMAFKQVSGTVTNLFGDSASIYIAGAADVPTIEAMNCGIIGEYHASNFFDVMHLVSCRLDTARSLVLCDASGSTRIITRGSANISDGASGGDLRMRDDRCIFEPLNAPTVDKLTGYAGQLLLNRATGDFTVATGRIASRFRYTPYFPKGTMTITTLQKLGAPGSAVGGGIGGAQ